MKSVIIPSGFVTKRNNDVFLTKTMMYSLTTFVRTIVSNIKKRKNLLIQIHLLLKVPQEFQLQGIPFTLLKETFREEIFREIVDFAS